MNQGDAFTWIVINPGAKGLVAFDGIGVKAHKDAVAFTASCMIARESARFPYPTKCVAIPSGVGRKLTPVARMGDIISLDIYQDSR
jgi:hypothetical protein